MQNIIFRPTFSNFVADYNAVNLKKVNFRWNNLEHLYFKGLHGWLYSP